MLKLAVPVYGVSRYVVRTVDTNPCGMFCLAVSFLVSGYLYMCIHKLI